MNQRILLVFPILFFIILGSSGFIFSADLGNQAYYKDGKPGLFYYEYKNNNLTIVIEKTGKKYDCILPETLINIANMSLGDAPIFKITETAKKTLTTYYLQMKIGEAEFISGDLDPLYVDIAKVLVSYKSPPESKYEVIIKYNPSGMPKVLMDNEMGIGKAYLFDTIDHFLTEAKDPSQYSNLELGDIKVNGLKIFVSMGRISGITAETDKYSTSRGLKVTDSKEKVLKLYGLPDAGYYEDEKWVYYLKRYWDGEGDYYISSDDCFTLGFKNGKVKSIYFYGYIPAD